MSPPSLTKTIFSFVGSISIAPPARRDMRSAIGDQLIPLSIDLNKDPVSPPAKSILGFEIGGANV